MGWISKTSFPAQSWSRFLRVLFGPDIAVHSRLEQFLQERFKTLAHRAGQTQVHSDEWDIGVAAGCKPRELIKLLAADHHNPTAARAFLTAVLSVKTPPNASPEVLKDIDDRIEQAVRDLSKKLGVPAVAWIHNSKTRHAHVLFPNSDGRRTLRLARQFLKELQGFGWTEALASGRGKGQRKALPVYTHSRQLDVRDLAASLLDQHGRYNPEALRQLIASGDVTDLREAKNGRLISFQWHGRRIRQTTLEGFIKLMKGDTDSDDTNNTGRSNRREPIRHAQRGRDRVRSLGIG